VNPVEILGSAVANINKILPSDADPYNEWPAALMSSYPLRVWVPETPPTALKNQHRILAHYTAQRTARQTVAVPAAAANSATSWRMSVVIGEVSSGRVHNISCAGGRSTIGI
jgi:hypothetical protein